MISAALRTRETGQPTSALWASSSNFALSMPGTFALVVRWILVMVGFSPVRSRVRAAVVSIESGVRPALVISRAKGHGEAAGVSGGDELFGVGADAVGEAGFEAVLCVFQGAALGGDCSAAFFEAAFPDCTCATIHRGSPFLSGALQYGTFFDAACGLQGVEKLTVCATIS